MEKSISRKSSKEVLKDHGASGKCSGGDMKYFTTVIYLLKLGKIESLSPPSNRVSALKV
jgi:hypothetical protein